MQKLIDSIRLRAQATRLRGTIQHQWDGFCYALQFLTRLRGAWLNRPHPDTSIGPAVTWFGAVGGVLGGLLAAAAYACVLFDLPVLPSAAVLVGLSVGLSGALHLDGLADCGDAWMSGKSGAAMRVVLKDVHVGTGALVAVSLILLTKFAATAELLTHGMLGVIWLCPAAARACMAWYLVEAPGFPQAKATPADPERNNPAPASLSRTMRNHANRRAVRVMAIVWLLLTVLYQPLVGGAFLLACLASVVLLHRSVCARLGGANGDVYGALVEVSEAAILLLAAWVVGGGAGL